MILGVDQGATISLDAGLTWSSWYNQPTGQFYHVITDNQFPYVSYAPQQDSGTAAVPNRSDYGEISYRDWFSIGGFEFCYIAPDPLNPNIVYSGGWYGSTLRWDKTTGQIVHVFVRSTKERMSQMPPLVFSPQDPHTLYLGAQYVLKTTNGGNYLDANQSGPYRACRRSRRATRSTACAINRAAEFCAARAIRKHALPSE